MFFSDDMQNIHNYYISIYGEATYQKDFDENSYKVTLGESNDSISFEKFINLKLSNTEKRTLLKIAKKQRLK